MKLSLRRATKLAPLFLASLALVFATTGEAFGQEDDRDSDWHRADMDEFRNQLERAADEGDWEEYGRLWGEWGEEFGERMGEWGEKFGESFAVAFSEKNWEEFGERWEVWGEDVGHRMEEVDWEAYGRDWEEFGEEISRAFEDMPDDQSFQEIGARLDEAFANVNWSDLGDLLGSTFDAIDFQGLGDLIAESVEISIEASGQALEESLEALDELDHDYDGNDGRLEDRE